MKSEEFWWGTGGLAFRLSLDTYFMWYPIIAKPLLERLGNGVTLLQFQKDLEAFSRLKLSPGDWDGIAAAAKKLPHRLHDGSLTPKDFLKAERAFQLLSDKKSKGLIWDPWRVRFGSAMTKAEKSLLNIITPVRVVPREN
jgi:hypothetical protein